MINVLIVSYSLMAAIIGAGFASGQELLLYFAYFGRYGIIGIIVTVLFFGIFVYTVLNTCCKNKIVEYDTFIRLFKSQIARKAVNAVTLIFAFAVYSAMISATGEMLYDLFGIPKALGTLFCTTASVILFILADEKVFTINGFLGIGLVIAITVSAFYMLCYREYHAFSPQYIKSLNSGLVYSGYNLVSLTPVLVTLSKKLNHKTDCVAAAICVTIISAIIMTLIFGLLAIYANKISLGELPMLTLAKRQNPGFASLYSAVLTTAILTTLISSGGGLFNALKFNKDSSKIALISSFAYLFSGLGFYNLINIAYRICGLAGLVVCIMTIYVCCLQNKNKKI